MPGDRRKRSLTPHAAEQKRCSKRIRKGSESCKAERTSRKPVVVECKLKASNLTLKSVLPLSGDSENACLLFLEKGQKVCIKGMALIKTLTGLVNIFGCNIGSNHDAVQIFSPSTSSLLTISECSELDATIRTDLKRLLKRSLQSQPLEVFKKALVRTKKAASVLLIRAIETLETTFVCSFSNFEEIFSLDLGKDAPLGSTELSLKKRTAALGFTLLEPDKDRCGFLTVPEEWKIVDDIMQQPEKGTHEKVNAPVILICGGKDIGKSTFARYLSNLLLNSLKELYFLECDVGQSEFTPPGLISLNRVCKPLLGPPFTHLRQPERSVFFGDISPKDRPEFYVKCIHSVYQTYADNYRKQIPLIVNTQGWVKGMGVPLLLDVIRIVQPSHIIQFNYTSQENTNKNLPALTEDFLMNTPGWAFVVDDEKSYSDNQRDSTENSKGNPNDKSSLPCVPDVLQIDSVTESTGDPCTSKFSASDHRSLALLSYFSRIKMNEELCDPRKVDSSSFRMTSLLSCVPYQIPWSCVAIHVLHTEVAWNQILYSINASIVGLAQTRSDQMHREDDNTPFYLRENPITDCMGLGIVRNIDPVKRLLYVLTPQTLDSLRQVNTLLKGNLEIPAVMLLSGKQGNAPYVSTEFSYELRGAGARKVRYNLQRRKKYSIMKE